MTNALAVIVFSLIWLGLGVLFFFFPKHVFLCYLRQGWHKTSIWWKMFITYRRISLLNLRLIGLIMLYGFVSVLIDLIRK